MNVFSDIDIVNRYILFVVSKILIFICYFRLHIFIFISHCISIFILSFVWTNDDETGYSVYLGFPESRATYIATMCKSFEEK